MKNLVFLLAILSIGIVFANWALGKAAGQAQLRRFLLAPLVPVIVGFTVPNAYAFMACMIATPVILARNRGDVPGVMAVLFAATPVFRVVFQTSGAMLLLTDTLAAVSIGSLLAVFLKPGARDRASPWRGLAVMAALTLFTAFIDVRGLNFLTLVRQLIAHGLLIVVPTFILVRTVRTRDDVERLIVAVVSVSLTLSVVGIYEGLRSWPLYQGITARLDQVEMMSLTRRVRGGLMRAPGPFAESTSFGFFLAIAFLFTIGSNVYAVRSRKYVAAAAVGLALILTQSRGAWLGAGIGGLAMAFHMRRNGTVAALVIAMAIGYPALTVFSGGRTGEITGVAGAGVGTADYRKELFRRSLEEARPHPFIGQDVATVRLKMEDMRQGEGIIDFVNFYAYALLTSGIVGLAIFLAIVVSFLRSNLPRPYIGRGTKGGGFDYGSHALFASMIACLVMIAFTSLNTKNLLWFGLLGSFSGVFAGIRRRDAAQTLPSRPAVGAVAVPQPAN